VGEGMGGHFIELYPTPVLISLTINSNAYLAVCSRVQIGIHLAELMGQTCTECSTGLTSPLLQSNRVSPPDGTNGLLSFSAWKSAHGFDLNSTYSTNLPTRSVIVLRRNKYEPGRANLVV
jgi:hypothetical protein